MMTSSQTMPSVSGTKRKWYRAVAANCSRERSTNCSLIMRNLLGKLYRLRCGGQDVCCRAPAVHRNVLVVHEPLPEQDQRHQLEAYGEGKMPDETATGVSHTMERVSWIGCANVAPDSPARLT